MGSGTKPKGTFTMHKTGLLTIAASMMMVATGAWAQQPSDPHHPPDSGQPSAAPTQPQAAPAQPQASPGTPPPAGGMPMMQMMMGQGGMMPMTGPAGAQGDRRMGPPGAMTGGDGSGSPINVIINIGPGIRVDASEAGGGQGGAMRGPGSAGRMPMEMMRGARGGMSMQGPGAGSPMAMPERVEGRLAFLRAELGITDAQREAWERYAQAVRAAAVHDREMREAAPAAEGGALARLARGEALLAASLDRLRAVRAALEALLPSLTEEQRRTLDQLLPMAMMMMGPGPQMGQGMAPGMGMGMPMERR
jgi:hypothetical protein